MADRFVRIGENDAAKLLAMADGLGRHREHPGPAERLLRRLVEDYEEAPERDDVPRAMLPPHDVDAHLPGALELLRDQDGWVDAEVVDERLGPEAVGALLRAAVMRDDIEVMGGFALVQGRRR